MPEPHPEDIRDLLLKVSVLLKSVGETWWSEKAEKMATRSDGSYSSEAVLSWFGGMGSFNDILLIQRNGFVGSAEVLDAKNAELRALQTQLYLACLSERR